MYKRCLAYMNYHNNQSMENSIIKQLKANRSKNLLYIDVEHIMDVDPSFLAALEKLLDASAREKQGEVSSNIISFAAQALLKRLYSVNQYTRVDDQQVEELKEIYWETWRAMQRTRNVRTVLVDIHYPALSRWLASLYPKEFRKQLRYQAEVGHVVNEEYTAEFQMELFQLDTIHMKQPVVDIGCGSQANLVIYLRSRGIEAYGFDRQLEVNEPYLEQIDWFEYPFSKDRWGTIISNMAFTNHLNYVYYHDISQLKPYLLRMKDILASLATGGSFHYAPALPFIEDRLDADCFIVERRPAAGEVFFSTIIKNV